MKKQIISIVIGILLIVSFASASIVVEGGSDDNFQYLGGGNGTITKIPQMVRNSVGAYVYPKTSGDDVCLDDGTTCLSTAGSGGGGNIASGTEVGQFTYWESTGWAATSSIFIDPASNIGVGTTVPAYSLDVNGDVRAVNLRGDVSSTTLNSLTISGSELTTLNDYIRLSASAGRISGGVLSDNGDSTITVSAGMGAIRSSDDKTAQIYSFSWSASSSIAVGTSSVVYVGIDYNSGSPKIITNSTGVFTETDSFPLGSSIGESGIVHVLNNPENFGNSAADTSHRFYETRPFEYAQRIGGGVIANTGTRNLSVTAYELYDRRTEFPITAKDTSGSDYFTYYYRDGSGDFTFGTSTQWNNTLYDNGTGVLATLNNNYYGNHWIYQDLEDDPGSLILVYGRSNNNSLATALDQTAPATLPLRISNHCKLVGRIVFSKNSSTLSSVTSYLISSAQGTAVSNHNNLGGLQGGTIDQYYHLTSANHSELTTFAGGVTLGATTISGLTQLNTANASTTNLTVSTNSQLGTIVSGVWNGTAIDFSSYVNATADTGIQFTGDAIGFDCSEVEGTGINCVGEAITLDATGDWTGTIDSIDGSNIFQLSTWYATTTHALISSLPSLSTVGTIGTGVWQGTDVGVAYGGTGVSTLTDHGVLVGSGATAITALTVGTNGQLLVGSTGADPVFATLNCDSNLTCTAGAGTLEIDVDDSFLLNTGDAGTGYYDFGSADSFNLPNGASPRATTSGSVVVDTTDDDQLVYYGDAENIISGYLERCFTIALTSTSTFEDAYIWHPRRAITVQQQVCRVDAATSTTMNISDGTNDMDSITCLATLTKDSSLSNNTWTADEPMTVEFGATVGSPTIVNYCIQYTLDRD